MDTTPLRSRDLAGLAELVAARGVDAVGIAELRGIAAAARSCQQVAAELVLDPAEPEVARQRAFGLLLEAIASQPEPAGRPIATAA